MTRICDCSFCIERRARAATGDTAAADEQSTLDLFRNEMMAAHHGQGAWHLVTFFQQPPRSIFCYAGGFTSAILIGGAMLRINAREHESEPPIALTLPVGFPLPHSHRGVELSIPQLHELVELWESLGLIGVMPAELRAAVSVH